MTYRNKLSTAVCVSALILLMSACAGPRIEPPGPDRQSILVLPVQVTDKAQYGKHGFYYIYEIAVAGSGSIVHEAIFKLPIRGDILIVDSLPPGDFFVDKFIFKTVGSGDFTYGNNIESRYDKFKLEAGKITILSESLNVLRYNSTPGRGKSTTYQFEMQPLTPAQKGTVMTTLKALPNFDAWEMSDSE